MIFGDAGPRVADLIQGQYSPPPTAIDTIV